MVERGIRGDVDRVVVAAVIAVALSAIFFAASNIYSYYRSFDLPTLTLLNRAGLAENYPTQIQNSTTVSFELQVIRPQADRAYGVQVYVSNGTGYASEVGGPMGLEVFALSFPHQEGNLTLPVNLTLTLKDQDGTLMAETITLNNQTRTVNLALPYGVIGLFFQLYVVGAGGQKTIPYAWTSLWLNVTG